jgi:hypothetical protein
MARIVHRGEVRGNGGVLEGEWAESRQSLEGVRRRAKLGKDLEETKLVGFRRDILGPECSWSEKRGAKIMSEPSKEELLARIAELEKQAGSRKKGSLEFRVGEKGGVSVYGLGRFPVTLYYEQWIRLLDIAAELRAFLEENKSKLKLKTAE